MEQGAGALSVVTGSCMLLGLVVAVTYGSQAQCDDNKPVV